MTFFYDLIEQLTAWEVFGYDIPLVSTFEVLVDAEDVGMV
jgi:hypothetical protein